MTALDHLVFGAAHIEAGRAMIEARLGRRLADGGAHPGQGSRNALGSLEPNGYLELLAPDESQPLEGTPGARLAALATPCLLHWALACDDLESVAETAAALGLETSGVLDGGRRRADGVQIAWKMLFVSDPGLGMAAPFFIDWGDSPHPSDSAPRIGALRQFEVSGPRAPRLNELLAGAGSPIRAAEGKQPSLRATLQTPAGATLVLESDPEHSGGIKPPSPAA